MKYLLKLARFISLTDQEKLIQEIKSILESNLSKDDQYKVFNDIWAPKNRILLICKTPIKEKLLEKIASMIGVWQIVAINTEEEYVSVKDVIQRLYEIMKEFNNFSIETNFLRGSKFHRKALLERWKKKFTRPSIINGSETKNKYYLEVNPKKYRIGKIIQFSAHQEVNIKENLPVFLIIQNPHSKLEIADFIRIGISFSIPVYIACEIRNKKTITDLLEGAKKIVKGWNKTDIKIIEDIKPIIESNSVIAFSMWTKKGEKSLKEFIVAFDKKTLVNSGTKLGLLFGNEKSGLTYIARKIIHPNIYSLGPHSSEPLRASQAATYALGIISSTLFEIHKGI